MGVWTPTYGSGDAPRPVRKLGTNRMRDSDLGNVAPPSGRSNQLASGTSDIDSRIRLCRIDDAIMDERAGRGRSPVSRESVRCRTVTRVPARLSRCRRRTPRAGANTIVDEPVYAGDRAV